MAAVDNIRNSLIGKLLAIKDAEMLLALDKLVSKASTDEKIGLTKDQIEMLKMSEDDFENGRIISHDELFEQQRKWLKEQ